MFCTKCGARLDGDTKFCTSCGAPTREVAPSEPVPSPDGTAVAARPPEPLLPSQGRGASGSGRQRIGTSVVAAVMALVTTVAVAALGVVIADPFGWGDVPQRRQDAPVEDVPARGEPEEVPEPSGRAPVEGTGEDDEPEEPADEESDAPDPAPSYVLTDSATRPYGRDELEALSDEELYHARNEIYARHGRRFKNADLQAYFGEKDWYAPLYDPEEFDARSGELLSEVEKKNAETMLSIEQERGSAYL